MDGNVKSMAEHCKRLVFRSKKNESEVDNKHELRMLKIYKFLYLEFNNCAHLQL